MGRLGPFRRRLRLVIRGPVEVSGAAHALQILESAAALIAAQMIDVNVSGAYQHFLGKAARLDQVLVTRTFGGENRSPYVHARGSTAIRGLVLRLHVIDDSVVFYVSVEAGDHNLD